MNNLPLARSEQGELLRDRQRLGPAQDLGSDVSTPAQLGRGCGQRIDARGVDGIIHTACTFSRPDVDIAGMVALLEAWGRGPFVFISSVSVYGRSRWLPTTEDHPLDDASGYGQGKIRCEALLADAARARQRSDWSVLRPPHIWGPDLRSIAHKASPVGELYGRSVAGYPLVLPGATEVEWSTYGDDWVDARELAWAAAECLDRPVSASADARVSFHW